MEGKRKVLYQKINYLTGYSENQIKEVEYLLVPYVISEDLSVENKQELKALESFKKASDYMVKKEKGSYLPVLGAFGGVTFASLFDATMITPEIPMVNSRLYGRMNELTLNPNLLVSISMKKEIFSRFERKHKINKDKINAEQLQKQLDDTKETFALLLENHLANYRIQNQKYQIGLE